MRTEFLLEYLKGRAFKRGRIILKWILRGKNGCVLDSSGKIGAVAGSSGHGNEPSYFIKGGKSVD
jgi:hypothetical protein